MPLTLAPQGKEVRIIRTLLDANTKRHMKNLGFFVGGIVTPIASMDGDLIVRVMSSKIAINKELAAKIYVE